MLLKYENKIYSQNGEDGIIEYLLSLFQTEKKYFVEIGVSVGKECNIRFIREHKNFTGVMFDSNYYNSSRQEYYKTTWNSTAR